MSHRVPKAKRQAQSRTQSQHFQSASHSANSSHLFGLSTLPESAETMPINATNNDAPSFITGPGATTFQPPISLSQLAANSRAHPAPIWPINDLLPPGLCLLAAKPHAGSHTLVLQLALSVARGTSALDHFSASIGEVLYLGFHETENIILARTQHLLDEETLPSQFSWSNTWQDWQQDGLDALKSWLVDHPRTRLLVIDSFSHLLPPGTSTKHAYQLLRQLNHLAHTHHLCILLLHSLARVSTRDPFSSIPCSPLLLETCETLAVLDHDRGTAQATLHLTGHSLSTRALPLSLTIGIGSWSLDTSLPHAPPISEIATPLSSVTDVPAPPRSLRALASDESHVTTIHICDTPVTLSFTPASQGAADPLLTTSNAR